MWVRKRIDISSSDLWNGLIGCLSNGDAKRSLTNYLSDQFLICLSVRSGFDLLLSEVDWPSDSEILMTAITIGDMPRIVRHHGYQPIPVDVDPDSLAPTVEAIRRSITHQTRAIVITHLAGGSVEMESIRQLCDRKRLMLIDDRAQAYVGVDEMIRSSELADVSMWSFGPVKTATALGGGLISIRDKRLRGRMSRRLLEMPVQRNAAFARRIIKYALLRQISRPLPASMVTRAFRIAGSDHDRFAGGLARGFAGDNFFDRIRHQPSSALVALLQRRLKNFDTSTIERRRAAGVFLKDQIGGIVPVLGANQVDHTFWLFAVLAESPDALIRHLWTQGFDATNRSSLRRVGSDSSRASIADQTLKHLVILPLFAEMPRSELIRLADQIKNASPTPPSWWIADPERCVMAKTEPTSSVAQLQPS